MSILPIPSVSRKHRRVVVHVVDGGALAVQYFPVPPSGRWCYMIDVEVLTGRLVSSNEGTYLLRKTFVLHTVDGTVIPGESDGSPVLQAFVGADGNVWDIRAATEQEGDQLGLWIYADSPMAGAASVEVTAGGGNYAVDDILTVDGGPDTTFRVTSVSSGGVITGLAIEDPGHNLTQNYTNLNLVGGSEGAGEGSVDLTIQTGLLYRHVVSTTWMRMRVES